MPSPADPSRGRRQEPREPRFRIDRAWLWRILLVAIVVAFIVLIAKTALVAFSGAGRRVDARTEAEPPPSYPLPLGLVRQEGRPGADRAREVAMLE